MRVSRHFSMVDGRRVHLRWAGDGPPLVLVHAAPRSSKALEPLMIRLAERHTVIAPDLPGFGDSAPLAMEQPTIADYAEAVLATVEGLGIKRADWYGSHTGAKVAIEIARRNPDRARRLVLDGLAVYSPQEQSDWIAHYTPVFTPEPDGSHLIRAWGMLRDFWVFWPWFRKSAESRLPWDLPDPLTLHEHFSDFLRGTEYWKGAQAAFRYLAPPALRRLFQPALLVALADDPMRPHLSRIGDLPANIVVGQPVTDEPELAGQISAFLAGDPLPPAPAPPLPQPLNSGIVREFVESSNGPVLVRRVTSAPGRPLVMFHAMPGNSSGYERLLPVIGADRPVYTFDNPGCGDSAPAPGIPEIWDFARILGEAIDTFGLTEFDAYGAHTGALIAMEMAIQRPDLVKHVICDGVTLFTPEYTADVLANYCPPIVPTTDGAHLIWAWNFRRDMNLWWPWYRRTADSARAQAAVPSADVLHAGYTEFLKGALTYHFAYRAAFAYPIRDRLPLVKQPILHCSSAPDPLRACIPEAIALSARPSARVHDGMATPDAMAETIAIYRRFLADEPLGESKYEF